jgi:hypothetical protein
MAYRPPLSIIELEIFANIDGFLENRLSEFINHSKFQKQAICTLNQLNCAKVSFIDYL